MVLTVSAGGGSTNMARMKVSFNSNIQMDQSTIFRSRMVATSVTELKKAMMDTHIEESSKMASITVMDSSSIEITMSMMVNGSKTGDTEKGCSRRHQLEELKEVFMKRIKSKKSSKS
jgi:hypothetical protein